VGCFTLQKLKSLELWVRVYHVPQLKLRPRLDLTCQTCCATSLSHCVTYVRGCVQRLRKRRSKSAARAPSSKSVKVAAKVKIKVEPADEVTCSTDDVRRHSTAAEVAKCESPDDALLPDTTTENIGDVMDVVDMTSFGDTCQSPSNRTVTAGTVSYCSQAPQQPIVVPLPRLATGSIVSQPYQHHYQYAHIHHAAPLYYRDDPAHVVAGLEQRFTDDIDDILSVMASVAGITQPHVFNY